LQVGDVGRRGDEGSDSFVSADIDDAAVADRNGLHEGAVGVGGVDLAVAEHTLGRGLSEARDEK